MGLIVVMQKKVQWLWPAEHCQCIPCTELRTVRWMHFGPDVMAYQDDIQVIVVFHIANRLPASWELGEIVSRARLSCSPSIEIRLVTSAPVAPAVKAGAAISVALRAIKPN